jgi:hypothetical protein
VKTSEVFRNKLSDKEQLDPNNVSAKSIASITLLNPLFICAGLLFIMLSSNFDRIADPLGDT